jgi:SPP1 gp7 family putative phage head morphogenesis protein
MPLVIKARKRNDPVLRSPTAKLNKFEQEIFDIYSKALSSMPKDLDNEKVIRAVRQAIESRSPNAGAVAFEWGDFVSSLDGTVPKLAQQLAASANISAAALPKNIRFDSSFTAQDPRAIAWAQQRAGARILGITQETQKAVAETIARSLSTQINREEVINNITQIVGLDSRQAKALGNFYEKNLLKLIEQGEVYEKAVRIVTKLSKEYRERLLIQRATRIARTETIAAANAGRMLSWAEADQLGLLPAGSEKRWKTAADERTCPVCGPLNNVTVDWEGVFSTGDVMPPNHPNCRCTAVIVPAEPTFDNTVEKRYYRFADGEKTWRNYNYKWRQIANEMKQRIGKCQRCGSKSDLTVDHKKRLKDGGAKYDKKNLRVLCRSCNGKLARLGTKLRKSDNSWLLAKYTSATDKAEPRPEDDKG